MKEINLASNYVLRLRIYENLNKWGVQSNAEIHLGNHLAHVLGYRSLSELVHDMNCDHPPTLRIIHMLAGPHGRAIYKMLLVQRGMEGI